MTGLVTIFFVGLLGSVHCIAMCGGISSALNLALHQSQRQHPLRLLMCVSGYQAGRILSYVVAGTLAGAVAGTLQAVIPYRQLLVIGNLIQALVLVSLGLYVGGYWRGPLALLERAGARFWRLLTPLRQRIFPVQGPGGALAMGLIWGWLPCGLTYSALITAMASARAGTGALYMLFFGLGTLPALLGIAGVQRLLQMLRPGGALRGTAGGLLIVLGLLLGTGMVLHAKDQDLQPLGGLQVVIEWCLARLS